MLFKKNQDCPFSSDKAPHCASTRPALDGCQIHSSLTFRLRDELVDWLHVARKLDNSFSAEFGLVELFLMADSLLLHSEHCCLSACISVIWKARCGSEGGGCDGEGSGCGSEGGRSGGEGSGCGSEDGDLCLLGAHFEDIYIKWAVPSIASITDQLPPPIVLRVPRLLLDTHRHEVLLEL